MAFKKKLNDIKETLTKVDQLKVELEDDEKLVYESQAYRTLNMDRSIQGFIYVTNRRIIFEPKDSQIAMFVNKKDIKHVIIKNEDVTEYSFANSHIMTLSVPIPVISKDMLVLIKTKEEGFTFFPRISQSKVLLNTLKNTIGLEKEAKKENFFKATKGNIVGRKTKDETYKYIRCLKCENLNEIMYKFCSLCGTELKQK